MIRRWDIVTIGNISRNRYWGESEDRAVRPAMCTSTLITADDFRLLVDPPIEEADRMAAELNRRAGITPEQVELVFITHAHRDHHAGLASFPFSRWLAAGEVADAINETGRYERPVKSAGQGIADGVEPIHTPGHTLDHFSLRFTCEGRRVVIAGDAVMNRDFWRDRRGYHNSVDFTLAAATMQHLAEIADVIVPGHDNYFLV